MKISIGDEIDSGQFATVYKGTDIDLERPVAVKIVRASGALVSSALDHAKALARTNHPNIATVYGLAEVIDPKTKAQTTAIVMELINGCTLEERLKTLPLKLDEAKTMGDGLIDGVAHIHEQGLVHQDLHEENVLVVGTRVKIIDIMYTTSLMKLTSQSRKKRLRHDVSLARSLLEQLLIHSERPDSQIDSFMQATRGTTSLSELREAFDTLFSEERGIQSKHEARDSAPEGSFGHVELSSPARPPVPPGMLEWSTLSPAAQRYVSSIIGAQERQHVKIEDISSAIRAHPKASLVLVVAGFEDEFTSDFVALSPVRPAESDGSSWFCAEQLTPVGVLVHQELTRVVEGTRR